MRAGALDRRITVECLALDMDGDPTAGQWNPLHHMWAEQMERGRLERVVSDQELATAERGYRVRYRDDIDPTMRVKHGEHYWRITGVTEGDGRRKELILLCSRYDPNDREFE